MNFTHVLYHGNCYDGFGAALAAWLSLGPGPHYWPVLYGQPIPDGLDEDSVVLICDFSYPRADLVALKERVRFLRVLDHHKTAQADLEGLNFATFDMEKSGAVMTWEYFSKEDVPLFFLYLQDRDLWKFELGGSKGVSQALRAYPFEMAVWRDLATDAGLLRLLEEGPVVERFTAQMVSLMCDQAVMGDVGGHQVPIANATVFFSEVGDELCRRHPEKEFSAYYLDRKDGLRQWGLRSRGGFDTSEVAKALGGGGHAAASGFVQRVGRVFNEKEESTP